MNDSQTPRKFPCAPFGEHLDALLADEAEERVQARWVAHRAECDACAASFEQIVTALCSLRGLPGEASAQATWLGLKSELADREAIAPWMELWRAAPAATDPARTWRALRRRLAPAHQREGIMLVAASVLLLLGLWAANDAAASAAVRWSPEFLATGLSGFMEGPLSALFLPLLFASTGGLGSLASLPLLRRGLRPTATAGSRPTLPAGAEA